MKTAPTLRCSASSRFGSPALWSGLAFALFLLGATPAVRASLDPDVQAYADRCSPPLDPYFLIAANNFVVQAKTAGWWSNLSAVYFFCAPTQQGALLNVKSNSMSLTTSGSVTFTPYTGMVSDGTTGYLDTGVAPASIPGFAVNSHSMFVFDQTDSSSSAGDAGSNTGGYGVGIRPHNGNGSTIWSANNTGVTILSGSTTALGLNGFVRTGSNDGFRIKNNVTTDFTNPAQAFPTVTFRFLRMGASSPPYSVNQLAFGLIGTGSMTKAQAEDIYPTCIAMLTTLGTWVAMEPELVSYIDRSPSVESWDLKFILAANRMIHDGKAHGWWQQMSGVYFFCAPTEESALLNVVSGTMNLTKTGTVAFTPETGMQGDGSTGYLDLGVTGTNVPGFTLNSHSMFVFSQSDHPGSGGDFGTLSSGTSQGIRARNAGQANIWSANTSKLTFNNIDSAQYLTGFVRTGSAGGFFVKNDQTTPFSLAAQSLSNGHMRFFRFGNGADYSSNQLAFGFIGTGSISPDQAGDLYADCVNMLGDDGLQTLADPTEPDTATPPHIFGRSSENTDPLNTQVTPTGLHVFRWCSPPINDTFVFAGNPPYVSGTDRGYVYGPLTDSEGRPWGKGLTSTDTQVTRWERVWSDRANIGWSPKANGTPEDTVTSTGMDCGQQYTTYDKAIGATLVKVAYSAGLKFRHDPDYLLATGTDWGWGDIAEHYGYDVSYWQTQWVASSGTDPLFTQNLNVDSGDVIHSAYTVDPAHIDSYFSGTSDDGRYKVSTDRIILGPGRTADMPMAGGFILDHEHADDRGSANEVAYVTELMTIAHCKNFKLAAEGHVVTSGAATHDGWTPDNANQLLNLFDWFNISAVAGSTRADLDAQYNYFKGPSGTLTVPSDRLCVAISIGPHGQEMTNAEAAMARQFLIDKGIMRCVITPLYATWGGALSRQPNQVIATFLGLPTE